MSALYLALLKARKAFKPVLKTETNSHFKSKYATLQDLLEATKDALDANGLILLQTVQVDEKGAWLQTDLIHADSGERITSNYPLKPSKENDPQQLGGALTYARKYSGMAILGIAPEDDDGETAVGRGQSQQQKPAEKKLEPQKDKPRQPMMLRESPTMFKTVEEKLKAAGQKGWGNLLRHFDYDDINNIPAEDYKKIMAWVESLGMPAIN